jgi:2-polyprenyl-6-methoxyphenol hydroxylase-like FAD-dependent oxidoreductase
MESAMEHRLGQHAVVIGGSLAGLMTARVLAGYFDAVTVLERDHIAPQPALHQSIPQGNHLHGLLLGGQRVMSSLYPGFLDKLDALGTVRCRAGKELVYYLPTGKAFSATGTVREPRDLGFDITCHSRGLLEHCVRQCTLAHTNVTLRSASPVHGLVYEGGRVCGVRYDHAGESHTVAADLVVDAGGRRSQAPRWLTELGFQAPEETTIGVDLAYASAKFRVPAEYDEPERLLLFFGPPPDFPNGGIMEVIEGNRWHVTLAGRFGAYPPHDAAGFLAFSTLSSRCPRCMRSRCGVVCWRGNGAKARPSTAEPEVGGIEGGPYDYTCDEEGLVVWASRFRSGPVSDGIGHHCGRWYACHACEPRDRRTTRNTQLEVGRR